MESSHERERFSPANVLALEKENAKLQERVKGWNREAEFWLKKMIQPTLDRFAQHGGEEVVLYRLSQDHWRLMVGNPSPHVLLGEVDGIYQVDGKSVLDVIEKMEKILEEQQK